MLRFDETDKYELKEILNDALPKEIETYLNTEGGGHIYIGVNKIGEVVGIKEGKLDETMLKVADVITDQVLPKCNEYVHAHHEIIENKDVIIIDIKRGNKLYYQKKYGMTPKGCHYRVGTKCQEMTPEEIEKRFISSLNIPEPDICEMESYRQDLTFQILKNYLSTHNYHYNDETFDANLKLRNKEGKYNYMAFLLADENDIVINVATFATNDKTEYLKRNEFGGKCLLLAMEQAKNYIEAINQVYVDTKVRPRREKPMFNMDAFKEAWYNACVHYKWSEAKNPGIYVYSDRLEIESFGGIPKSLTKEQFLKGTSKPVNEKLFDIFKTCGFVEESGHGVPTVTKAYGEKSYIFEGEFIKVVIPFDRTGFFDGSTQENENTTQKTTQEKLIELLRVNPNLSRSDLAILLKISEDGVKYQLKKLKDKGIIVHVGPDKGGHWEVK